jgi:trk system potassium uptake protein
VLESRRSSGSARRRRRSAVEISPSRWLAISFAGLIAAGTCGFLWLPGLATQPLSFIDALFMTTSAVCVTGLTVVDVTTRLTFAGQLWLLLLIQLGGLGILTFTTLVVRAVGRRTSLEVEEAVGAAAASLASTPAQLLRSVVVATFAFEIVGAALLWVLWIPRFGALDAVWPALFHAVSAFCNAGFSTFSDNAVGFASSPLTLLVLGALLLIGGIGFPVLEDLRLVRTGQRKRLATSSRLALVTSALLVAGGSGGFLLLEWGNTLAHLEWVDAAANAFFMAVTPRTAGFNSVDYDRITNASYLLTLLFMWIGGSPVSTAGGVKTTTVALLALLVWSRLRGQEHVTVARRTIPELTIERATSLALTSVVLVGLATLALLATDAPQSGVAPDRARFARILFEAQSALATVGLSMNLTPSLSDAGRLVIVACMFVGRIGPIAMFDALSRAARRSAVRMAHEDVLVG